MIAKIKKLLYFPVASYFRFFADIRLKRWNPKIVVVTGSNGKTTLLHLLESQIGENAKYSHHANSSFGIPFDILGLHRKSLLKSEWISLFIKAPFQVFNKLPEEKIYIVEADCDRPGEGKFLASFLKPDVVLWLSSAKTHSMNFEQLISKRHPERSEGSQSNRAEDSSSTSQNDIFENVEQAIAYEFGYFLEYCRELSIINGDSNLITEQVSRTKRKIERVGSKNLQKYNFDSNGTAFEIDNANYRFKYLLPKETAIAIEACKKLIRHLGLPFDKSFSNFKMPPGRGSLFRGIKNTTIIDSSYNSNLSSAKTILISFAELKSDKKWLVIGDMLEQGEHEKEEHEKLALIINNYKFEKIILMGPRVGKYTFPLIDGKDKITFLGPKETLDYIESHIKGGEMILFKGARFMEGVIEHLLQDKVDVLLLARREKVWEIRRKKWGL